MNANDASLVDAIVEAVYRLQGKQQVVLGDIAILTGVKSRNRIMRLMPAAVERSVALHPGQRLVVTTGNTYEVTSEFTERTMRRGIARGRSALTKFQRLGHESAVDHPAAAALAGLVVAAEGLRAAFDAVAALIPDVEAAAALEESVSNA